MRIVSTPIPGVLVLEPEVFGDVRGFFYESFNQRDFDAATGTRYVFVQDNHSRSAKGVLRGLHYQTQQAQGKLVRVVRGKVYDVAVDIRADSPTFGQWFGLELSEENRHQIWIPPGLAHGFLVLSDVAEVLYKTTDYYAPQFQASLAWNDPTVSIDWPLQAHGIEQPVLSARDQAAHAFSDL